MDNQFVRIFKRTIDKVFGHRTKGKNEIYDTETDHEIILYRRGSKRQKIDDELWAITSNVKDPNENENENENENIIIKKDDEMEQITDKLSKTSIDTCILQGKNEDILDYLKRKLKMKYKDNYTNFHILWSQIKKISDPIPSHNKIIILKERLETIYNNAMNITLNYSISHAHLSLISNPIRRGLQRRSIIPSNININHNKTVLPIVREHVTMFNQININSIVATDKKVKKLHNNNNKNVKSNKSKLHGLIDKNIKENSIRSHIVYIMNLFNKINGILRKDFDLLKVLLDKLVVKIEFMEPIFNYLSYNDLKNIGYICKKWNIFIFKGNILMNTIQDYNKRYRIWNYQMNSILLKKSENKKSYYETRNIYKSNHKTLDYCIQTRKKKSNISEEYKLNKLISRDVDRTTFIYPNTIYNLNYPNQMILSRIGSNLNHIQYADINVLKESRDTIYNILLVYCSLPNSIGYAHGMTHILALLLSCMDFNRENTFRLFNNLIEFYHFNSILSNGIPGTLLRSYQLEELLRKYNSDISIILKRHNITCLMFASPWIMTLFTYDMTMKPTILIKIMDCFIKDGWPGAFKIFLGILIKRQESITTVKEHKEKLIQALIGINKQLTMNEINDILISDIHITEKDLDNLEISYKKH